MPSVLTLLSRASSSKNTLGLKTVQLLLLNVAPYDKILVISGFSYNATISCLAEVAIYGYLKKIDTSCPYLLPKLCLSLFLNFAK